MNKIPKNKYDLLQFGGLFSLFFVILYLIRGSAEPILLYLNPVFLLLGLFFPQVLKPLHYIWMKLGHYLGIVSSYIALTILFFILLTPLALIRRLFHNRAIKINTNHKSESMWIERSQKSLISPKDMDYQF